MKILIKNAQIVNEGKIFQSDILIENDLISKIEEDEPIFRPLCNEYDRVL